MAAPKIRIQQIRSQIDQPKDYKATLRALGLGKIRRTVVHQANPALIGMVRKVSHLVTVEEVQE
jgi:large subunit ribosomal protein L30